MESPEQVKSRLENIRAVEPTLSGLATLSSGTRLRAQSQAQRVAAYQRGLLQVVAQVLPLMPREQGARSEPAMAQVELLAIGSERGLCGGFNTVIADEATRALGSYGDGAPSVAMVAIGGRLVRALRRNGIAPLWSISLSSTALPSYSVAAELAERWLRAYDLYELDAVDVVYNRYRGLGRYVTTTLRILPPQLPSLPPAYADWPPVIETDAQQLFARSIELWLAAAVYDVLLQSAAAEHAARYEVLDAASAKAREVISELELQLQVARQEAITTELQDLAIGAGLVNVPGVRYPRS